MYERLVVKCVECCKEMCVAGKTSCSGNACLSWDLEENPEVINQERGMDSDRKDAVVGGVKVSSRDQMKAGDWSPESKGQWWEMERERQAGARPCRAVKTRGGSVVFALQAVG